MASRHCQHHWSVLTLAWNQQCDWLTSPEQPFTSGCCHNDRDVCSPSGRAVRSVDRWTLTHTPYAVLKIWCDTIWKSQSNSQKSQCGETLELLLSWYSSGIHMHTHNHKHGSGAPCAPQDRVEVTPYSSRGGSGLRESEEALNNFCITAAESKLHFTGWWMFPNHVCSRILYMARVSGRAATFSPFWSQHNRNTNTF